MRLLHGAFGIVVLLVASSASAQVAPVARPRSAPQPVAPVVRPTTLTSVPGPTNVTATANAPNSVTIRWTGAPGATGYTVGCVGRGTLHKETLPAGATSFEDKSAFDWKVESTYSVVALYADGRSGSSALVGVRPPKPTNPTSMTATGDSNGVTLEWTPVTSAEAYLLKGPGVQPNVGMNVAVVRGSNRFPVRGLPGGLDARWDVQAAWQAPNGTWITDGASTTTASLKVPWAAPQVMQLRVFNQNDGTTYMSLKVAVVPGATGYKLLRADAGSTSYTDVTNIGVGNNTTSSFTRPGEWHHFSQGSTNTFLGPPHAQAGRSYDYKACAVFGIDANLGCTAPIRVDYPGSVPFSWTATAVGDTIRVTWQVPAGDRMTRVVVQTSLAGNPATGEDKDFIAAGPMALPTSYERRVFLNGTWMVNVFAETANGLKLGSSFGVGRKTVDVQGVKR